jgi:phospholipid/cholesterol/gamma-HCH transport system substrate-binding protein
METKANTALIGAFTLVVLALGFVFVYWLARGAEQSATAGLNVIFEDPVTGLSVGSQVVFNGIKVGDVKTLTLDPENPKVVIAGLALQPLRSVKADTQVTLGFQGLTGVGYVEMAGGSQQLPPIWEAMPEPTIIATRSSMQDLLAGARTILARTDETLQSLERIVSDNSDDIALAILDVRKFTSALAANSDDVSTFVQNVSAASKAIAEATTKLDGIVTKGEALLGAVEPEDVRQTLANIRSTTESLAAQGDALDKIMARADTVAANAEAFSQHLPAFGEKASSVLAAIDPEKVGRTIDNVDRFATTLGESSDDIDQIVADARGVSARFNSLGERADSLLTKLDSMAGEGPGGLLEDATETLAAIRDAANNFNAQVAVLGGGLTDFSDRGLRDFQNLVTEGQRTIGRLDRVISNLEQNPTGFLLGGERVPEYGGQRR